MIRHPRAVLALALLGSLAGCGLFRGTPEERSVTIDLAVSRSEAVRRTLTTFREEGYAVRATLTSGSQPETEPFKQGDAEAVFRATISGSAATSRVVLAGTYRRKQLGGIVQSGEHEVRNSDDPIERALWSRLQQIALAIRHP
ncbi:MAG: hypothetical protein DMD35_06865 [Gemmatimonadetes bacterium]|nr:MAG: hypothetical protein DMD35_06865 [Gemmatimonadota bacterium]